MSKKASLCVFELKKTAHLLSRYLLLLWRVDLCFFADCTRNYLESSSRVSPDGGVRWTETSDEVSADIAVPGLIGQPAEALAVELTAATLTVTAFGRAMWSCVLRGTIDPEASEPRTTFAAALGSPPVISIALIKMPGTPRWNGLIESIGVDSVLQ